MAVMVLVPVTTIIVSVRGIMMIVGLGLDGTGKEKGDTGKQNIASKRSGFHRVLSFGRNYR